MKVGFFLINLDGSVERLSSIKKQLDDDGVPFVRISAVDGRGKKPEEFKDYDAVQTLNYMGRPMKGGELGCYYSHLKCIDELLAGTDDYVVVIEDDAAWGKGTKEKIFSMLNWLEEKNISWDILNTGFNKNKIYSKLNKFNGFDLVAAHYFPMTTTCIIWSRQGAASFRKDVPIIYGPIDNVLREWQTLLNRGLATNPPLVSVSGAESDIDGGLVKRGKQDRIPGYWLKRQYRLWRQKIIALKYKFFGAMI